MHVCHGCGRIITYHQISISISMNRYGMWLPNLKHSAAFELRFPIWAFQRNPKLVHGMGVTATGIWTVAHLQECLSHTLGLWLGMTWDNLGSLMECIGNRNVIYSISSKGVGSPFFGGCSSIVYCSCVWLPFPLVIHAYVIPGQPLKTGLLQAGSLKQHGQLRSVSFWNLSVPTGHTEVRSKSGDKRRSSWCVLSSLVRSCSQASKQYQSGHILFITSLDPKSEMITKFGWFLFLL
jgi:hypothetical protein